MTGHLGRFVWHELVTPDPVRATAFYGALVGWTTRTLEMPGVPYTIAEAGGRPVAGLMEPPLPGVPQGWVGYLAVADVDASAGAVEASGGHIHRAPADIPGVGRFAVATDPQGARFMLFAPSQVGGPPPLMAPGTVAWNELHAGGPWEDAFAFYAGLFGWTKSTAVDMGPMGTYQLFAASGGGDIGGMMRQGSPEGPKGWLYYLAVADIDAAAARIAPAGGTLVTGPHAVPGGAFIVHLRDPFGADVALVGPRVAVAAEAGEDGTYRGHRLSVTHVGHAWQVAVAPLAHPETEQNLPIIQNPDRDTALRLARDMVDGLLDGQALGDLTN